MISPDNPKIDEPPISRRHKAWLVFKVIELRLRFVMILVINLRDATFPT